MTHAMTPIPPFAFATAGTIRLGRGTAAELGPLARELGGRALLVHGRDAARAEWARDALQAAGLAVATLACVGEPDLDAVLDAAAAVRANMPDVVVGVGGGAVIDMAKAVAALAPATGDAVAHLEIVGQGAPLVAAPLPVIAVPTTAGTGSEVTRNAVIGVPSHGRKVSLRDARMLPRVALVDPALTDGCPWPVTLASGLDAVTQVIEPFVSCKAQPLTDALCDAAIPRGLAALRVLARGEDPRARDDMAVVSLCGGLALANSGLGIVHGLAGPLGGLRAAPHGAICAALLPHALAANAVAAADTPYAGRIARVMAHVAEIFGCAEAAATDALGAWSRAQGIPGLGAMGFTMGDLDAAADAAGTASSTKGNPVPLSPEAIRAILTAAA